MREPLLDRLAAADVPFAVFGSAAGDVYGWSRPANDLDVFVSSGSIDELRPLLPRARRVGANGLRLGKVEVWAAPLRLPRGRRMHTLGFDALLAARRIPHPAWGWVLAPEDQLLIKLTLRRTTAGKRDLDDAAALVRHWGHRLDLDYLAWRVAQLGVMA